MKNLALAFILCCPLTIHAIEESIPTKAHFCASCHGVDGLSSNPDLPNLAGQHPLYLAKQIRDIKAGTLAAPPEVQALVATLSEREIEELARYYARMPRSKRPQDIKEPKGEAIYTRGEYNKQVTACITCHGPEGSGNNQAGFPVLAGQNAAYTLNQLQAFKTGQRTNDLNHIMQRISSGMNKEEMKAVAEYTEGLN